MRILKIPLVESLIAYTKHIGLWFWVVIVGMLGGILGHPAISKIVDIPLWVWALFAFCGLLIAPFVAFHRLRMDGQAVKRQLEERASLYGTTDCARCGERFMLDGPLPDRYRYLCPRSSDSGRDFPKWDGKTHRVVPLNQEQWERKNLMETRRLLLDEFRPFVKSVDTDTVGWLLKSHEQRAEELRQSLLASMPMRDHSAYQAINALRKVVEPTNWFRIKQNIQDADRLAPQAAGEIDSLLLGNAKDVGSGGEPCRP